MVQIHPPLPITMIKKDIEAFLIPIIEETGCELWGIEFGSAKGKGRLLRIYIDAIQGVDIDDCTKVSREIDYHFQHESIFSEFAYEPIWAIGTGLVPSETEINEAISCIRNVFNNPIKVLYGGSVKASNAKNLLDNTDINGLLVGGASLNPQEFGKIAQLC